MQNLIKLKTSANIFFQTFIYLYFISLVFIYNFDANKILKKFRKK